MMRDKKELCNELINYFKEVNPYEFNDCYNNMEEAYDNFYNLMTKDSKGILTELKEELHELIIYNDLRNKDMKNRFEKAIKLAYDLNVYYNHTKEKDIEL